ncbi:MAG: hypothetical protein JO167_12920 [Alphaproteobacteria bacterium]|nr:hypothetical protein [Alphaproteobacteria bacterium]
MRKLVAITAAFTLSIGVASAATSSSKIARPLPPMANAIPAGLTTAVPAVGPSQIANCANLAATRAMDAKAAGAGFEVQRRLLDFTFALCIAGEGRASQ